MDLPFRKIKFDQSRNPEVPHFDLLRYQEILERSNLDHFPWKLHRVDFFIILIVTEGQGQHTIDFTDFQLQAGTVLTIRRDQVHKFIRSQIKGYLLIFTEEFILDYLLQQEALKTLQLFNELLGSPKLNLSERELREVSGIIKNMELEFFERGDEFSLGINRSLLHVLISKLFRNKANRSQLLKDRPYLSEFIQFQQLVEEQCFQNRTVQKYAPQMGISTKTLNKVVQSVVHKSAKEFIDEVCVLQIKRLLSHSNWSIKEIAYQAGFDEPTNLFKYFKKQTGVTPEAFRRTTRP